MEMELNFFTKAQKELQETNCQRNKHKERANGKMRMKQKRNTTTSYPHRINNAKERSKWKSYYMKQAMKRREASGRVVT